MSSRSNSVERPAAESAPVQSIACNGCRKAKLRCSRDKPTCLNCARLGHECVYETKRVKPGVKAGAIESIHRRLEDLENKFAEQSRSHDAAQQSQTHSCAREADSGPAASVLSLLARELPKLVSASTASQGYGQDSIEGSFKRRRVESNDYGRTVPDPGEKPPLPTPDLLKRIVDTYFSHTHPWIPMLNQDRFRQGLDEPCEMEDLEIVIHAIQLAVARYLPEQDAARQSWPPERVRKWVLMTAMDEISMESAQALIIVAFNDIGSGRGARAWSIVASLSRVVEYLQITMDRDGSKSKAVTKPFGILRSAESWSEQEERRRVFWNVFLLDRFCSITMGWNTSLTSIDVHQRLPCDGILWRKQEAVTTPYLGIWDKSTEVAGDISTMASRRPDVIQASLEMDRPSQRAGPHAGTSLDASEPSGIGAFAYCVEATESMSRVTSYFLQQRIDPTNSEEVSSWLTRFKELDRRLVHWKMFLPQKWKSNRPKHASRMDPNLTLAHITHNASTILLHQLVAYPPLSWSFRKKLPSAWSAKTCCLAGIEISKITRKYLEKTPQILPIASPFAFCVFIAARVMLIHWRHDMGSRHLDEFWALTHSLEEISRRWCGPSVGPETQRLDLAAKYAWKLRCLHRRCMQDRFYRINVTDYTHEIDHSPSFRPPPRTYAGIETEDVFSSARACLGEDWGPMERPTQPQNGSSGTVQSSYMTSIFDGFEPIGSQQRQLDEEVAFQPTSSLSAVIDNEVSQLAAGFDESDLAGTVAPTEYLVDMERVIYFNDGSLFSADLDTGGW